MDPGTTSIVDINIDNFPPEPRGVTETNWRQDKTENTSIRGMKWVRHVYGVNLIFTENNHIILTPGWLFDQHPPVSQTLRSLMVLYGLVLRILWACEQTGNFLDTGEWLWGERAVRFSHRRLLWGQLCYSSPTDPIYRLIGVDYKPPLVSRPLLLLPEGTIMISSSKLFPPEEPTSRHQRVSPLPALQSGRYFKAIVQQAWHLFIIIDLLQDKGFRKYDLILTEWSFGRPLYIFCLLTLLSWLLNKGIRSTRAKERDRCLSQDHVLVILYWWYKTK